MSCIVLLISIELFITRFQLRYQKGKHIYHRVTTKISLVFFINFLQTFFFIRILLIRMDTLGIKRNLKKYQKIKKSTKISNFGSDT